MPAFVVPVCQSATLACARCRSCAVVRCAEPRREHRRRRRGLRAVRMCAQSEGPSLTVRIAQSIESVPESEWNDLLPDSNEPHPFLRHSFLRALESSRAVSLTAGWVPSYILFYAQGSPIGSDVGAASGEDLPHIELLVGAIPAYRKRHSQGEFVFDHRWAELAYEAGINYYPKLLVGVPFTPVAGARLLLRRGETYRSATFGPVQLEPTVRELIRSREEILATMAVSLKQLASQLKTSSVHVNFISASDELDALRKAGFSIRSGVQYHFVNSKRDVESVDLNDGPSSLQCGRFTDFDDYLSIFKSKRRMQIRRERRRVCEESGIRVEVRRGAAEISRALLKHMFYIYRSTIEKMMFWGNQYLNMEFFEMLADSDDKSLLNSVVLILAYDDESAGQSDEEQMPIAGTVNFVDGNAFYGRYWGALREVRDCHFEVCYYRAIEYVIEHGLMRMEPGAGGGEFKSMRGFQPVETQSAHWCVDPRLQSFVERYCTMEAAYVVDEIAEMRQAMPVRRPA